MSLSKTQINNLRHLLQGEKLAWSALDNDLRQTLIDEELVSVISHGSHKTIYAQSTSGLQVFLEQHYEELRGFDWIVGDLSAVSSRAELAANSGNSKTKALRSCPGFLVNSYMPISAKLGDNDIVIQPEEGTMLFVADWKVFRIPENVIVVGVENMENFRQIRKQKNLFQKYGSVLFVSRYPQSCDLINWLKQTVNQYVHFGDYDLAGLHIYETEFYNYLFGRASFFVPDDIETRLQKGSMERYNIQYERFKNYKPTDKRLLSLFGLIHRFHRCYDQEGYIYT